MNRVVLIGNGFDLAHGMKTGYVDFIKWYVSKCIKAAYKSEYTDSLIRVDRDPTYRGATVHSDDNIEQWMTTCFENGFNLSKFGPPSGSSHGGAVYPYIINSESKLFTKLQEHCALKRWVDVEAVFYETLLDVLTSKAEVSSKEGRLKRINYAMSELITQLEIYLSSLLKPLYNEKYYKILYDYILEDDLESTKPGEEVIHLLDDTGQVTDKARPVETRILNFNYTNTIGLYAGVNELEMRNVKVNNIHGQLNNAKNKLVFGFGDELDKRYTDIENEGINEYFTHIKSFAYFRTPNYKDLVSFVDGRPYQVIILGHSCGLSDRTLLNMLLEHVNCKSIKLYFYGDKESNNYTDVTYEIARHFHNKSTMRKRIVSLDRSSNMPQTPVSPQDILTS